MSDTPPERRNCWTCGYDESDGSCSVPTRLMNKVDIWMGSRTRSGPWAMVGISNMPPRTTPTDCPGWTRKENDDD